MSNFKFVVVALACALLASAAVPSRRSVQYLQQNGPAAKALNDQYASLTTSSSCDNDGDVACISNQFAVCYEGRYITHTCPSGWSCAALPNEWSEGTSTTCDTNDNISWRFSQAGISEFKRASPPAKRDSWIIKNGPATLDLTTQYKKLSTSSSCSDGQVACIGAQYAVCSGGKYSTSSCASNSVCSAIPNDSGPGTTTRCATWDEVNSIWAQIQPLNVGW